MSQNNGKIIVAPSVIAGRGVLATEDIAADELIEVCPIIIIPANQVQIIHSTVLHDYYFLWGDDEQQAAIALGYGSMYNHATHSNAAYKMDYEMLTIDIYALRDIVAGEEIFINYHGAKSVDEDLWFEE